MKKVLIIDDDTSLLQVLNLSLSQQNFQVITSTQGEAGVRIAKAELPDIILLDLILPDLPGIEILHRIKFSNQ